MIKSLSLTIVILIHGSDMATCNIATYIKSAKIIAQP